MPTIDYFNDFATVANSRILTGTISAVNSSDCTVTVNGLAIPGVPYFYHCQHDTIDHGSRVFRVGDNVLLLHDGQLAAPSAANLRVIGFPDKLERCRGLGLGYGGVDQHGVGTHLHGYGCIRWHPQAGVYHHRDVGVFDDYPDLLPRVNTLAGADG